MVTKAAHIWSVEQQFSATAEIRVALNLMATERQSQKVLSEMNVQFSSVLSDISGVSGVSGMNIITPSWKESLILGTGRLGAVSSFPPS